MNNINTIEDFDVNLLKARPGASTFIGGSYSGKSSTVASVIRKIQEQDDFFDLIFVYSAQKSTNKEWLDFLRGEKIVTKNRAIEVLDLDKTLMKIEETSKKNPKLKFLLIIDDFIGGVEGKKELQYKKSTLKHIFYKSRHHNLWSFFLLQEITVLSARFLGNTISNFVFVENSIVTITDHLYPKILCSTRKFLQQNNIGPKGVSRMAWVDFYHDLLDDLPHLGSLVIFKDPKNKMHLFKNEDYEYI